MGFGFFRVSSWVPCCLMVPPDNCIMRAHCPFVSIRRVCDRARCAYAASLPTRRVLTARYRADVQQSPLLPPVGTWSRPFIGAEPRLVAPRVCVGRSHPCFGPTSDLARDGTVVQKRKKKLHGQSTIPDASNSGLQTAEKSLFVTFEVQRCNTSVDEGNNRRFTGLVVMAVSTFHVSCNQRGSCIRPPTSANQVLGIGYRQMHNTRDSRSQNRGRSGSAAAGSIFRRINRGRP